GPVANEKIKFNLNPVTETLEVMRYTFSQHRDVVLSLLGKGWFFCIGSMFMSQFPNYVKTTIGAEQTILTLFTVLFSIGIAIGGLCNNRLLRGRVVATYVPLAALGLSLFALDIYAATAHVVHNADGTLLTFRQFISHFAHWRIIMDVCLIAVFGGLFVVPLTTILQDRTPNKTRAQIMAGSSITDSLFMVASAIVASILISFGFEVRELFLSFAIANVIVAIYICRLLPDYLFKTVLQILFKFLYNVEIRGLENVEKAGPRAVIVGNHVSFLDPPLLAAFLPGRPMFAVNTHIAQKWWVKPFLKLVDAFPLDPTNPYSMKALIRKVEEDRQVVIFPEGRLTATGSLMKIYDGPGLIADKANAMILPVRLDGVQYTGFSRLKGKMPFRRFPKITITFLEPRSFKIDENLKGRARRAAASRQLYDVMEDMMLATTEREQTLWDALLKTSDISGNDFSIVEDAEFNPLTYKALTRRATVLGHFLARMTVEKENVGLMLPNSVGAVVAFFALQSQARVSAMLNFTTGSLALVSACKTADIKTVITSRRFVQMAHLESLLDILATHVRIVYLEDIKAQLTWEDKLSAFYTKHQKRTSPHEPAIVLFTSGSEGAPKGVVLSHANLLTNIAQLSSRVAFNQRDIVFNCLPMFHSFGLTGGTLLPLLSGVKVFLYPNPLHLRI
ncbi:MAG: AMP-binding protein, partial [Pseudomonadota bacterium]